MIQLYCKHVNRVLVLLVEENSQPYCRIRLSFIVPRFWNCLQVWRFSLYLLFRYFLWMFLVLDFFILIIMHFFFLRPFFDILFVFQDFSGTLLFDILLRNKRMWNKKMRISPKFAVFSSTFSNVWGSTTFFSSAIFVSNFPFAFLNSSFSTLKVLGKFKIHHFWHLNRFLEHNYCIILQNTEINSQIFKSSFLRT